MDNNYFLKEGYESLKVNMTLEKNRINHPQGNYWSYDRSIKTILNNTVEYQNKVYEKAEELIKENNLKCVFDVGCGFSTKLDKYIIPYVNKVYGFDQQSAIDANKKYLKNENKVNYILSDFDDEEQLNIINIEDEPDMIICSDVIEHVLYPDILLNFIKKKSKKNTLIIFSTPERDAERGINCMKSNKCEHVREWNKDEFNKYISYMGFNIIDHILVDKSSTDKRKLNQVIICKI